MHDFPNNKTFCPNFQGRDFVVNDIHGCYWQLMNQLKEVSFDKTKDRLFAVGDLVDRGPDSLNCLSLIFEPWFHTVLGNHDHMMYHSITTGDFDLWFTRNWGADWFKKCTNPNLVKEVVTGEVFKSIPYTITVPVMGYNIGISHAEPPVDDWDEVENMEEWQHDDCLYSRAIIQYHDHWVTENIDYTIHGHSIIPGPRFIGNAVFIDHGSFLKEKGQNLPGVKVYEIAKLVAPVVKVV